MTATRDIFAKNLLRLTDRRGSVASVCREMGMNRTQYNRYLSGESHPRPDVLKVIVEYFSVDANILLHKIDVPKASGPTPYELGFGRGVRAAAVAAADYCHARLKMAENADDAAVFTSHTEYDIQNAILRKFIPEK